MKTAQAKIDQVLRGMDDDNEAKNVVTLIVEGEGKAFVGGGDQPFTMRLEVVGSEALFAKLPIGTRFVISLEPVEP